MAFQEIIKAQVRGRKRKWTITILEDDVIGSPGSVVWRPMAMGAGSFGSGSDEFPIDRRLIAYSMTLDVLDPDGALFSKLNLNDNVEDQFRVRFTDSTGEWAFRLRIRQNKIRRRFFSNLESESTRIYLYDGLSRLDDLDAIFADNQTWHDLFKAWLVDNCISQDIKYVVGRWPSNIFDPGPPMDLVRFQSLSLLWSDTNGPTGTQEDQLKSFLDWVDLVTFNSLRGYWYVGHRYALGQNITGRPSQEYDADADTLAHQDYTGRTASKSRFTGSAGLERESMPALREARAERGPGREVGFLNILRNGAMEGGWRNANDHRDWLTTGGGSILRSNLPDTGNYSLRIGNTPPIVQQNCIFVAAGSSLALRIRGRYAFRNVTAGSSTLGELMVRLRLIPFDTTEDIRYMDGAGQWVTSDTYWDEVVAGSVDPTDSLIWATYGGGIKVDDVVPVDGHIQLQITTDANGTYASGSGGSGGGDYYAYIDNFAVTLADDQEAAVSEWASHFNADEISGGGGPGASQGRSFRTAIRWVYCPISLEDFTADPVGDPVLQADQDGAGGWFPNSYWELYDQSGIRAYDPHEWGFRTTWAQQKEASYVLRGEIEGILTPEVLVEGLAEDDLLLLYCKINFETEVTTVVALPKQHTFTPEGS